jgi:hypothetical protein
MTSSNKFNLMISCVYIPQKNPTFSSDPERPDLPSRKTGKSPEEKERFQKDPP